MQAAFARAMQALGPFQARPALAVAVSGGADSMALAVLARDWVRPLLGSVTALTVDHGLRAESADEARQTADRLLRLGIDARILRLTDLAHGSALAERARIMRYDALTDACRGLGCLHLLLGHHAGDQAETLAMRVLRASRSDGLAGMAALRETPWVRLLRPLLGVDPAGLRHFLAVRRIAWVEDPSNQDRRTLRARMRQGLPDHAAPVLARAVASAGRQRSRDETARAEEMANRVTFRPEGFAIVAPGRLTEPVLSSLVQAIGGALYPPNPDQVADLARHPRAATLAGVRIAPAGRFGEGFLVMREEAAMQAAIPARADAIWDGRFRVSMRHLVPSNATIGPLGPDAAAFRDRSGLPSRILRTLPALRIGKVLAAVPHLRYADADDDYSVSVSFSPSRPAAGAAFLGAEPDQPS